VVLEEGSKHDFKLILLYMVNLSNNWKPVGFIREKNENERLFVT
jgi:hypothetical protein